MAVLLVSTVEVSSATNMLLNFINNALQKYFASDVEIAQQLSAYEGKVLLIKLTDLKKEFIVIPQQSTIVVSTYNQKDDENNTNEVQENSTTTIQSNVMTLLRLGLGADYQTMLNDGALKIDGDAQFANQLRNIFMQVDIDWEEVSSKYVGDAVAYQLGNFARRIKGYKKRSVENFRLDVSEYIQEESRLAPTKTEVEHFLNDVDVLHADIERLEARMRRLDEAIEIKNDDKILTGAKS